MAGLAELGEMRDSPRMQLPWNGLAGTVTAGSAGVFLGERRGPGMSPTSTRLELPGFPTRP